MGGVAVIEVLGTDAPALLEPHLRSRRPIRLSELAHDEVRWCQFTDGDEVIDDALVCTRESKQGVPIVDLSLHGGPRIVQRVLMVISRAGARIVEPREILGASWPTQSTIEAEAVEAILSARTRAVAVWLSSLPGRLITEIQGHLDQLGRGDLDGVRAGLADLLTRTARLRYLVEGVRVVLVGEPNTGKSTLANALAEREHAIVSDVPGTTRDWTEHPSAIDGIPVTFVDTAGLRTTEDPIEREAIRRGHQQIQSADVILRISDLSAPPSQAIPEFEPASGVGRNAVGRPILFVWNKSDLSAHPLHDPIIRRAGEAGVAVSARTGTGLSELRQRLVKILNLTGGPDWPAALFTPRQVDAGRSAESALGPGPADPGRAEASLRNLMNSACCS